MVSLIAAGVRVHWSLPLEGRIVDRQTGSPVEGVVVVASWQPEIHLPNGWFPKEPIAVMEGVTDREGRFRLEAWGPRVSEGTALRERAPQILLFKTGYEYQRHEGDADLRRLALKPFDGRLDAYAAHLSGLSSALEVPAGLQHDQCGWRSLPRMLRALDRQDTAFRQERVGPLSAAASLRSAERHYLDKGCGSVNAMLVKELP